MDIGPTASTSMTAAFCCSGCGFLSPPTFRFCGQCGQSLGLARATNGGGGSDLPAGTLQRECRQLTILFCDLVGSTALSSQMDAEDFGALVADYFDLCNTTFQRHRGYVDGEEGDSLRVYFGYPTASDDDALRAVRAALEDHRGSGATQCASRKARANSVEQFEGRALAPLVSRDGDLALLEQRWALACKGHGQIVLLEGEPGIGKSRLLHAFCQPGAPIVGCWRRSASTVCQRRAALIDLLQRYQPAGGRSAAEQAALLRGRSPPAACRNPTRSACGPPTGATCGVAVSGFSTRPARTHPRMAGALAAEVDADRWC
jgi:hypothetical protein